MPTRLYGRPRECPVTVTSDGATCGAVVRAGHLMCGHHWRAVPKAQRDDVWATLRAWQRGFTDPEWDAYLTARTAALSTVGVHRG